MTTAPPRELRDYISDVSEQADYLAKLPTLSRKLEVALSWAANIPFPPNIVPLRLSKKQSVQAGCETAETSS